MSRLLQELDALPELESLIRSAIDPDAPATITEGGIICAGFDETLDKYRKVMSEGDVMDRRHRSQRNVKRLVL